MNDFISRQAAIDEIEYELEMINSALDSLTLDFNARERLLQRRGEAREILDSIQQLPSAQQKTGKWLVRKFENEAKCSECGFWFRDVYDMNHSDNYCRHCGAKMEELKVIFI